MAENIRELAEQFLPDDSYFIVDVTISGSAGNKKVKVLVDCDQGMNIDVCSSISRQLSRKLDQEDMSQEGYTLEVSSPGLDYPLGNPRRYRKNIGRDLKIVKMDKTVEKGELLAVDEKGIRIRYVVNGKKKERREKFINFDEIKETNVMVTFKK